MMNDPVLPVHWPPEHEHQIIVRGMLESVADSEAKTIGRHAGCWQDQGMRRKPVAAGAGSQQCSTSVQG